MTYKTPEEVIALAKQCGAHVQISNNGDATCAFFKTISFEEDELQAFAAALTAAQPAGLNTTVDAILDAVDRYAPEYHGKREWVQAVRQSKRAGLVSEIQKAVTQPAALPGQKTEAEKVAFAAGMACRPASVQAALPLPAFDVEAAIERIRQSSSVYPASRAELLAAAGSTQPAEQGDAKDAELINLLGRAKSVIQQCHVGFLGPTKKLFEEIDAAIASKGTQP